MAPIATQPVMDQARKNTRTTQRPSWASEGPAAGLADLDGREQDRRCGAGAGLAASAGVGGTGCWLLLPALVVITGGMLCGRPSLQSTDVSWSVLDGRERDWQWGAVTRPLPASTGVGGTGSDRRQGAAAGHRNPRRA